MRGLEAQGGRNIIPPHNLAAMGTAATKLRESKFCFLLLTFRIKLQVNYGSPYQIKEQNINITNYEHTK